MAGDPRASSPNPPFVAPHQRHGMIGPFSGRQLALALVAVLATGGLLFAVTRPIASAPSGPAAPAPGATQYIVGPVTEGLKVGDRAPELETRRSDGSSQPLTDVDGHPISLAALRGHPVWISFWATWCPSCQDETPVLRDLYKSYRDRGLAVVAISVQEASAADVKGYATRYKLDYTIGTDLSGAMFRLYRGYGLPTQFFLDSDGIIRSVVQGPVDYNLGVANLTAIMPAAAPAPSVAPPSPGASPAR